MDAVATKVKREDRWTVTGTVAWESRPVIVMDLGSDHLLVFQVWPAVVNAAGLQATNKQWKCPGA